MICRNRSLQTLVVHIKDSVPGPADLDAKHSRASNRFERRSRCSRRREREKTHQAFIEASELGSRADTG